MKLTRDAPGSYPYIGDLPSREIFHPNCRHTLSPVRDPGIFDAYADSPGDDVGSPLSGGNTPGSGNLRRMTPDVEAAIRASEESIRYLPYEKGVVFDYAGNKQWEQVGEERRVNISEARAQGLLSGNVFTHNHPDSYTFSRADIGIMLFDNIGEIRATSPLYLHRMSRGKATVTPQEMAEEYEVYRELLKPQYTSFVKKGILEEQEASIELYHDVVSRLSAKYGFDYTREALT